VEQMKHLKHFLTQKSALLYPKRALLDVKMVSKTALLALFMLQNVIKTLFSAQKIAKNDSFYRY
jgi:hypothetical protein